MTAGILQLPTLAPDMEQHHANIVKEAKELNQLIYSKLAEEALATSRAMKAQRPDSGDKEESSWGARKESDGYANNGQPAGSRQRGTSRGGFGQGAGPARGGNNSNGQNAGGGNRIRGNFGGSGMHPGLGIPSYDRRKSGGGMPSSFDFRGGRGK